MAEKLMFVSTYSGGRHYVTVTEQDWFNLTAHALRVIDQSVSGWLVNMDLLEEMVGSSKYPRLTVDSTTDRPRPDYYVTFSNSDEPDWNPVHIVHNGAVMLNKRNKPRIFRNANIARLHLLYQGLAPESIECIDFVPVSAFAKRGGELWEHA